MKKGDRVFDTRTEMYGTVIGTLNLSQLWVRVAYTDGNVRFIQASYLKKEEPPKPMTKVERTKARKARQAAEEAAREEYRKNRVPPDPKKKNKVPWIDFIPAGTTFEGVMSSLLRRKK